MKLTLQVCTYDQAEKLKELGVNQDLEPYEAYWVTLSSGERRCFMLGHQEDPPPAMYNPIRAFNVAELGIMLPRNYASFYCGYDLWRIANLFSYAETNQFRGDMPAYHGKSLTYINISSQVGEAAVRASLLIELIELKRYSAEEVNRNLNYAKYSNQE